VSPAGREVACSDEASHRELIVAASPEPLIGSAYDLESWRRSAFSTVIRVNRGFDSEPSGSRLSERTVVHPAGRPRRKGGVV